MQVFPARKKTPSLAFWVCRRCLGSLSQAQASSPRNGSTTSASSNGHNTHPQPFQYLERSSFIANGKPPMKNGINGANGTNGSNGANGANGDHSHVSRPTQFFNHEPITEHSSSIVKALQGKLEVEYAIEVFNKVKTDKRLHWSIFSTYVPFLLSHKLYDEALEVMRDGVQRSMTHPHLYNLFLRLLFEKGQHDMALSFLKEVGYTPFLPTVTKWLAVLTSVSTTPALLDKAMDLAEYLATSTSLKATDVYPPLFKALLFTTKPAERCLSILEMYKSLGEPLPDAFTLPLLNNVMIAIPDMDHLNRLIKLTSTDLLLKAIHWYIQETPNPLHGPLHIFYVISRFYPQLKSDYFRTLGYRKFVRMWRYFSRIIEARFDSTTLELQLDERDSALLSALAIIPSFGPSLLDRMAAKNVTVDSIYYEFKLAKDQAADPASLNFVDPEAEFAAYCRAIEKHGVFPSAAWNCHIINTFLREGKVERATEVFAWMKAEKLDIKGVHLCFATFYIRAFQPDLAVNMMVHNTVTDGVKPTIEECNQIVDMLGQEGFIRPAKKMCANMSKILQMHPTLATQHLMLKNTIAHLGIDEGFIFLDRLRSWKVKPDKAIYILLLEASVAAKRWEKLKELRESMRFDKIYLDMELYNLLLKGYLKMGDEHEASDLMQRFVGVGNSPNAETYKILLQHHTAAKNIGKITQIVRMLMDRPAECIPHLKADLVKAYLSTNGLLHGFLLARRIMQMNLTELGRDLLDMMFYAACYTEQFDLAKERLLQMKKENHLPSSSVITMVLERMSLAKYDCTDTAAQFGIPVPTPISPVLSSIEPTPVQPTVPVVATEPAPTTRPQRIITESPSPIPTPIRTPTSTPIQTASPVQSSPTVAASQTSQRTPEVATPPPIPTPTPKAIPTQPKANPFTNLFPPQSPPDNAASTLRQDLSPLAPTSPIHSPSSPPASFLSRTVAYQFYDKYAVLRETQKKRGLYSNYFESDDDVRFFGEVPEEKESEDPFKQYVEYEEMVADEAVEEVHVMEKARKVVKNEKVQEEKRDFKLWKMFSELRLW